MAGPGKKRYAVTLTESTVKQFQQLAAEMKLPQGSMSSVLDDSLTNVVSTIRKLREKGSASSFGDLFHIIGDQLKEMEKEVAYDDQKAAEAGKKKEGAGKKA